MLVEAFVVRPAIEAFDEAVLGRLARCEVVPFHALATVRSHLPAHGQDICCEDFNNAFARHEGDARQEETSHRIV